MHKLLHYAYYALPSVRSKWDIYALEEGLSSQQLNSKACSSLALGKPGEDALSQEGISSKLPAHWSERSQQSPLRCEPKCCGTHKWMEAVLCS